MIAERRRKASEAARKEEQGDSEAQDAAEPERPAGKRKHLRG